MSLKRIESFNFPKISKRHQVFKKTKKIGCAIWKQGNCLAIPAKNLKLMISIN